MVFDGGSKGLRLNLDRLAFEVVDVANGDWKAAGVMVHDVANRMLAHLLVELPAGSFPVALGVIYDSPAATFEGAVVAQNLAAAKGKTPDLAALIAKGQTWQVDKEPHVI